MVDRPKTCIFCGTGKPTKEHVFGKWLYRHLPRNMLNYDKLTATQHRTRSVFRVKTRSGDPRSLSVRCACRVCNNGWMSHLQELAKPIVTPMALGKPVVLDAHRQIHVATWAAMVTMTSDFDDPAMSAISQTQRDYLFVQGLPPQSLRVWIGHMPPGLWRPRWIRHPIAIADTDEEAARGHRVLNTLTSTHVIGQLFLHIFSCLFPDILLGWRLPPRADVRLHQIWPLQRELVVWPPKPPLTPDLGALTAAAFFDHSIRSAARTSRSSRC